MKTRRGLQNQKNKHQLSEETLAVLRAKREMIEQYEVVLSSLQESFVRTIENATGANLKEEAWGLDLETGVLHREDAARAQ